MEIKKATKMISPYRSSSFSVRSVAFFMGLVGLFLVFVTAPLFPQVMNDEAKTGELISEVSYGVLHTDTAVQQDDTVSVCFVLPYINGGPASFFGHVFIRFSQGKQDFDAPTLSYLGKAENDIGMVPLLIHGIAGKLEGQYEWGRFSSLLEHYVIHQQRTIIEYTLDFQEDEIDSMKQFLHAYEQQEKNYNFLFNNCTTGLAALFNAARPDLRLMEKQSDILMPKDLIMALQDAGIMNERWVYPPLSDTLYEIYSNLDVSERRSFWAKMKTGSDEGAQDSKGMQFLLDGNALLQGEMGKRATVFTNPLSRFPLSTEPIEENPASYFQPTYGALDLFLVSTRDGWKTGISIHPLRIEGRNQHLFSSLETSLELGGMDFLFYDHIPRFQKMTILSLSSLTLYTPFQNTPSWSFDIGLQKDHPNAALRFSTSFGLGYAVGSPHFTLYLRPRLIVLTAPMDFGISVDLGATIRHGAFDFGIKASYPLLFPQSEVQKETLLFLQIQMARRLSCSCSFDPFQDKVSFVFRHFLG